ncbi:methyl-accepting chemotaxis protein [Candidatus Halocynthiibacter alkanivorans]|uniref:methyl-accepting chemotaxis protein n=1 Tax=Candidatus Halocynthiibacter alkanivorans TaxID=2267619 RepID=UPI0013584B42|nr:methyl-accepting chemotaxis protein [Candidatus Halocynthiibacter alkanivorans]
MKAYTRIKLSVKLPAIMILMAAIAVGLTALISYKNASKSLLAEAEVRLETVASARQSQLDSWINATASDIKAQANSPTVASALRGFGEGWSNISGDQQSYLQDWYITRNPNEATERELLVMVDDGSAYSQIHKLYHPYFAEQLAAKGFYDIFLFDTDGNMVYSVKKETDFATNFLNGEWKDSGLGMVVRQALAATEQEMFFDEFRSYGPSAGEAASFAAVPVLDRRGKVKGVLAYQMPTNELDQILVRPQGLGRAGEAFLVGPDYLLRSDLRLGEGHEALKIRVEDEAVSQGLAGNSGVATVNSAIHAESIQDLTAYSSVSFFGTTFALIVSVPIVEILEPAAELGKTMMWQGALILFGVGLVAFFVARATSKPLTAVEGAMRLVSNGDYSGEVPGAGRGDEIGGIANALDDFRTALADAEQATRDGLFKGSAFEGSSAALMMVNQEFDIIYTNLAVQKLMKEYEGTFKDVLSQFSADALIGTNIDVFDQEQGKLRTLLGDSARMPFDTDMRVGNVHFSLSINSVLNAEGTQVGCVMEWKDVTQERKNTAIIQSIDANQAKAEFSLDGALTSVNTNFCDMLGASAEELLGRHHDTLFNFDPAQADNNGSVWDRVMAGEAIYGRFKLVNNGSETILDGAFSPVNDHQGNPFAVILMGNDITASQTALAEAEAERLEMQNAQAMVVDLLRVGLGKLADGVLTGSINEAFAPEYENLRIDFNRASGKLLEAMQSVVENADMIRGEAAEISNAADDLSKRTEKQAATLEETAAALDELTSSVRSAAEGASQASTMVEDAKANAEESGMVVQEAVSAMSEIEKSSDQISKITSVIDDIAFQTNLLALNAGVEAARAGEAGRGFAVVASEVRALAQRSSDAAREINELISKSGGHVKRGVELVGNTGQALRGIVSSVSEIATHVTEIAVSAKEQSVGLAEINASVNQLDQVTQQNAAMFEETTAASHSLTREAETLNSTMAKFDIGSGATQQPVAAPVPLRQPVATAAAPAKVVNAPAAPAPNNDAGSWEDF